MASNAGEQIRMLRRDCGVADRGRAGFGTGGSLRLRSQAGMSAGGRVKVVE